MLITIDAGPAVALENPDDFTAFSIARRPGVTNEDLTNAVAQLGRAAGADHVYVTVEALTRLAGSRAADQDRRSGLAMMTAYAQSKGWVDEVGGIRAHIEQPGSVQDHSSAVVATMPRRVATPLGGRPSNRCDQRLVPRSQNGLAGPFYRTQN